jgi:hypothetical protein
MSRNSELYLETVSYVLFDGTSALTTHLESTSFEQLSARQALAVTAMHSHALRLSSASA